MTTNTNLHLYFHFVNCFRLQDFYLRYSARAFSSCGERGLLFVAVCRLLIAMASLVAEQGLQVNGLQQLQHMGSVVVARGTQSTQASAVALLGLSSCGARALECRLSSCGPWAQLLHSMWDLPRPGIEPMFPALASGFSTTTIPGKSHKYRF